MSATQPPVARTKKSRPVLFEQVFDILRDHIFILDEEENGDFRLIEINHAMSAFFGQTREVLVGRRLVEIIHQPSLVEEACARYREVLRSGEPMRFEQTSKRMIGLDFAVFDTSLYPLHDDTTGRRLVCGTSRNITMHRHTEDALRSMNAELQLRLGEIECLQHQLREQAMRDTLTGLFNRRYFEESLPRELARAHRNKEPVTLLMLDVDHFKNLNDTYGHPTGDAALLALANYLQNNMRTEDILCRYGGEEFIAVMPGVLANTVLARLEDWRRNQWPIEVATNNGHSLYIRFSAGLAEYPRHGHEAATLIECADRALYRAKTEGRDRAVVFANDTPAPGTFSSAA